MAIVDPEAHRLHVLAIDFISNGTDIILLGIVELIGLHAGIEDMTGRDESELGCVDGRGNDGCGSDEDAGDPCRQTHVDWLLLTGAVED